jgi:phage terminase Nu1 subunit (DNA packaging protein)
MSIPQQAELAKALGVSPAVVSRDKARGMPVHSIDAAKQWRLAHVRARIQARHPDAPTVATPPAAAAAAASSGGDDDGQYWQSRARREAAEANLAELKLAEQRGQLVRAADVRASYAKRAAGLREALLQIPSRLAAVMAAETDQAKCHDLLQDELHGVLASLTDA